MRGKAYAITMSGSVIAVSLSRLNAQEMLMEYALDYGAWWYSLYLESSGHNHAIKKANSVMRLFDISEYNLI